MPHSSSVIAVGTKSGSAGIVVLHDSSPILAVAACFEDPVLPIEHCTLRSFGDHFCDAENSEAFVGGQNITL